MTAACDTRRSAGTVRIVGIVRTTTDLAANSFQQSIFFAATGARFALEAGPAARRLPVRSTLGAAVAAVTVVVDLLVVAVSLDGLLGTPARYGAPWAAGVPVDLEAPRQDAATLAGDPRVDEASLIATGGLTVRPAAGSSAQLPVVALEHVAGRVDPVVLDWRVPGAPDEAAVGTTTARQLDIAMVWRRVAEGTGALVETVPPRAWVVAPAAALALGILVAIVPVARAASMRPAQLLRTE